MPRAAKEGRRPLRKAIHDEAHRLDPDIKESTRHYYQQISTALAKLSKPLKLDIRSLSIVRVMVEEFRKLLDALRGLVITDPPQWSIDTLAPDLCTND